MNRQRWFLAIYSCTLLFAGSSCLQRDDHATPKPKGYFRLSVPEHQYSRFDSLPPFTFDYATAAEIKFDQRKDNSFWLTIYYRQLNAFLNVTYIPVTHNLRDLILEQEKLVKFHIDQGKADDIEFSYVRDTMLIGQIYDLKGKDVACPMQFWLSDSANHWLRASLYFNFAPNNDSLQPVIRYLREDIMHLIGSFQWKKQKKSVKIKT